MSHVKKKLDNIKNKVYLATMDTTHIRKQILKKMIDLDLRMTRGDLAKAIARPGFHVNRNELSMALTGYRDRPKSYAILVALRKYLKQIQTV